MIKSAARYYKITYVCPLARKFGIRLRSIESAQGTYQHDYQVRAYTNIRCAGCQQ